MVCRQIKTITSIKNLKIKKVKQLHGLKVVAEIRRLIHPLFPRSIRKGQK